MNRAPASGWRVPQGESEAELVVRKSRFIARVVPVGSREQVKQALARARRDYPDARHHCWAYLLGRPGDAAGAGMSDDGEPAGTAGKPILNALQYGELGDCLVIVIRYFGGIKLGAGGLVCAYGAAAKEALAQADSAPREPLTRVRLSGAFADEQPLRHVLSTLGVELEAVTYGEGLRAEATLPEQELAALRDWCAARGITLKATPA
jgi:uncharacterized YigZ family protein